jgi:hypothetical protein
VSASFLQDENYNEFPYRGQPGISEHPESWASAWRIAQLIELYRYISSFGNPNEDSRLTSLLKKVKNINQYDLSGRRGDRNITYYDGKP